MPARVEQMLAKLRALHVNVPDIEASAVVSMDGLIMASALPRGVEPDRVSAISAALLSLGERILWEMRRGALDQIFVKGEDGYVVLISIGGEAVLTALARKEARLGMILLAMRRAAGELRSILAP
jgi:predicted regulator of Ras-like GTPase activity (Roadblock/LC7/MglB family)